MPILEESTLLAFWSHKLAHVPCMVVMHAERPLRHTVKSAHFLKRLFLSSSRMALPHLVSQKASVICSTGVISRSLYWSARALLFRPLASRSSGDAYCSWPAHPEKLSSLNRCALYVPRDHLFCLEESLS